MTEKEAVQELSDFAVGINQEVSNIALGLAIQALEKQIPKKPTIIIDYKKYTNIVKNAFFLKGAYWCPNCKCVIKCGTFCKNCGQRLDWSDKE